MPLNTGNMGGIGDFVAAITGRDQIRQKAQRDAWSQADDMARARKLAAESRIAEDEYSQRGGLAEALTGLGLPPELAVVMRGGFGNFPQATQGTKDIFDLNAGRQALEIAQNPEGSVDTLNRILATRFQGGGPLSPQQAQAQALGDAMLAQERAQTDLYQSGAAENRAQADAAIARGRQITAKTPITFTDTDGVQAVIDPEGMDPAVVARLQAGQSLTDLANVPPPPAVAPARVAPGVPARQPNQGTPPAARAVDTGGMSPQEREAYTDAVTAVGFGRISREEARKRLYNAGYTRAAEAF